MIETFVALSFEQILTYYVFQPAWMVGRKRHSATSIAHMALVLALSMAVFGRIETPKYLRWQWLTW